MKRTFVGLVFLLFAGFFTTCTGDDVEIPDNLEAKELAEYKEDAKANLSAYFEALDPNDYSGENWAAIEELTNRGKENIDTAADKQSAASALAAAMDGIKQIPLIDKAAAAKELAEYKEVAKANLSAYFEALYQNDYSGENWAAIEELTNKGKENIDTATNVHGAASALEAAFVGIRQIPWVEKTEEEHLERIREKLQRLYFNDDGTPTYRANFPDYQYIDNKFTILTVTVESFDVEILLSFDGIPEHFLVTYKPLAIGYTPGLIIGNEYLFFELERHSNSNNPFEENGIEKGNRFYMFGGTVSSGYAAKKDWVLTDLWDGHIYSENEIKNRLEFLRSEQGLRFMRNYFGLL